MHESSSKRDRAETSLGVVERTIRLAAGRYATRFGIERLREEIMSESVVRVLTLVREGRAPFNASAQNPDAADRMQRFTHGLVANVAREALRGRVRHGHAPLEDRASACAVLRVGTPAPERAAELEETIRGALGRFRTLPREVRETIVAEEIMQNEYASDEAGRLCLSCEVSFERVFRMIQKRQDGLWSAEAWRQRVHRSRKKARAAVGAGAPFALIAAMLVGFGAMVMASWASEPTRAPDSNAIIADDGSTQNGKGAVTGFRVASTQNGKSKSGGSG